MEPPLSNILISVVICTHNGAERIPETLESLHSQSLSCEYYEVIVIDNASTLQDVAWLKKNEGQYKYKLVLENELGLSAARNKGINESCGEYIYFIDDDAVAPSHLLSTLFADIHEQHPDVLGGAVHGLWEKTPPAWLYTEYWRMLSLVSWGNEKRLLQYPEILIGCNMMIKKSLFDQFGLFDTKLGRKGSNLIGHEERELQKKIFDGGGIVLYNPQAYVFHKVPVERMTMTYFIKRYRDAAYSNLVYLDVSSTRTAYGWKHDPLNKKLKSHILNNTMQTMVNRSSGALKLRIIIFLKALRHACDIYRFEVAMYLSKREGRSLFFQDKKKNKT